MIFNRLKSQLPAPGQALAGRDTRPFDVPEQHAVLGTALDGPYPEGLETAIFGSGCFWGTEELFWRIPGVWTTAVGYAGGATANPTYEEVCSGRTGHTEAVKVVYDPAKVSYADLLKTFWETHDPTQGFRQGNDVGTQYRSAILYTTDEQKQVAEDSRAKYGETLKAHGYDDITTEIVAAGQFWYAEDYHQQYLKKYPHGYRCHSSTGVAFPKETDGR